MDNEKYGIELDLILGKFRQKMQEVKNAFKGVGDKKINVNANTSQLENLKYQIDQISAKLRALKSTPMTSPDFNYGDILKTEAQLEKLTNQYNKLIGTQKELSKTTSTSTNNMMKGLDKTTSKIKRFGLALLSVRSIFSLVSRASSAYLSQDTELANKLQSAWVGLGAILAPIINFITTLILKLVSVINGFVKALTGVDLIAKASAKSMKGAAGSANALKKSLAGFDELTNLDSDTSGGAGIGGFGDIFDSIDTDWANMMENIYDGIDTFKTNIIGNMKESINGAKKVLKEAGFSDEFIEMYEFTANGSVKVMEGFIDSFKGILMILDGILSGDKDKIWKGIKLLVSGIWEVITGLLQVIVGAIGMAITLILDLIWKGLKWVYDNVLKPASDRWNEYVIKPVSGFFTKLWDGIKTGASNAWNWITGQLKGTKENFRTFINTIGTWFNNLWNGIKRNFANLWNPIANTLNKVGGKLGMTTLPTINSYAVGTNYVPEDQLAFIHKGEAVVPKKYNTGSYQPSNNDETNYLLNQVINAINNIEINPYTTVKDVGKASLSYINSKSRQLGESVVY